MQTVNDMWRAMNAQRDYPPTEGWKYLTLEGITGMRKRELVRNLTQGHPELYEIPFWKRTVRGPAYVIIRKRRANK